MPPFQKNSLGRPSHNCSRNLLLKETCIIALSCMARHLWLDDIEQRMQIRAAKDGNPALTYNDLRQQFGVSPNIIKIALEKTIDEWKAIIATTKPVSKPRNIVSKQVAIKKEEAPPLETITSRSEPMTIIPPPSTSGVTIFAWEYRTIIIRSRVQFNNVVYEQQGHDNSDWKLLAVKTFEDALNMYGTDKWELAGMAVLNHGAAGFTGLYELVFKRLKH